MNWPRKIGQPRFLSLEQVNELHDYSLAEFGGLAGVRDAGLLQSACAQASTGFGGQFAHEFPFGMAAAYGYHIAKNHPFFDGNKRTAFAACVTFLHINGWNLTATQDDAAEKFVKVAEGSIDKAELSHWLESSCRPRPSLELRDFFSRLDYSMIVELGKTVAASSSSLEVAATILEATEAIPIVIIFEEIRKDAHRHGDTTRAFTAQNHVIFLTLLYRIAEDMGYEW